jgi:hypothetical protein
LLTHALRRRAAAAAAPQRGTCSTRSGRLDTHAQFGARVAPHRCCAPDAIARHARARGVWRHALTPLRRPRQRERARASSYCLHRQTFTS